MNKIIFVVLVMVIGIVGVSVDSEAKQVETYINHSLTSKNYEDKELQDVEMVIYNYNGFRASMAYDRSTSNQEIALKMGQFARDILNHMNCVDESQYAEVFDTPYFYVLIEDGYIARSGFFGNGTELYDEVSEFYAGYVEGYNNVANN